MGRELLHLRVKCGKRLIFVSTSHLESLADHSATRCKQLILAMKRLKEEARTNDLAIFGGDLNVRQKEANCMMLEIGAVLRNRPKGGGRVAAWETEKAAFDAEEVEVSDVWENSGAEARQRFTFDLTTNDNIPNMPTRARYDRIYMAFKKNAISRCTHFQLIGKERLKHGRFPSDHYGIVADFTFPEVQTDPNNLTSADMEDINTALAANDLNDVSSTYSLPTQTNAPAQNHTTIAVKAPPSKKRKRDTSPQVIDLTD